MLTCEICGEDFLLEEDLKTHLLLSHEENTMSCPLCLLSGVSYDELCFHISSAHAEEQSPKPPRPALQEWQDRDQDVDESRCTSGCSGGAGTADSKLSLSGPCRASGSCGTAATAPDVETDTGEAGAMCLSPEKTLSASVSSQRPKTRAEPSSYSKAKQKRLSSPRPGDSACSFLPEH